MNTSTLSGETITYAGHTIDLGNLPQTSLVAMFRKGLAHFVNNEQASKITTAKAKAKAAGTPLSDEAIVALRAELVANAFADLREGSVGVRESNGAPRATPLESLMREIATKRASHMASINKGPDGKPMRLPRKSDDVLVFANGAKYTRDQLIQRQIDNWTPAMAAMWKQTVHDEATKELARREREAAKVASQATQIDNLDDLI